MPKLFLKMKTMPTNQAPIETKLICIDTAQGELVYKYFNKLLSEAAAQRFEDHLLLCFRCQDTMFTLDAIFDAPVEDEPDFSPPVAVEAEDQPIFSPPAAVDGAGVVYSNLLKPEDVK